MRTTIKTLTILFLLSLVIDSSAQQICVTIKGGPANAVNADILSYLPNETNTSTQYFQAAQWTFSGTPGESRDFLRFNLSAIPAGSVINSAVLNLYADTDAHNEVNGQPMYGSNNATYLMRVTSPWNDSTVTWNTQPATTTNAEVLLAQSTSTNENYLNLDVASFVQAWLSNPSQNYGIMSKMIGSDYLNSMVFCSGNYPDSTLWPTLVICYTPGTNTCINITGGPGNTVNADILSYLPNETNTSTKYFQAAQWTFSGTPGESRDFLRFDLSTIPTGAVITSATLNLYADTDAHNEVNGQPMYGTSNATYLMQVTSPWSDSTVTWNTQPATTTDSEVLLAQSTSVTENYLNLDVAPFVQAWVNNPTQNYGIMSKMIGSSYLNSMVFCSGNYPDSTLWPSLAICYTTAAGIGPVSSSNDHDILIYPNPNNGHLFNIKLPGSLDIANAVITAYDMLGKEIPLALIKRQSDECTVSLNAEIVSGFYMVGLKCGGTQIYKKVIVEK